MIRLIILGICVILCIIATLFVYPFILIVGLFSGEKKDRMALSFVQFNMRLARLISGAQIEYKGLENLPKAYETVVYIGNHRGFFDIIATYPRMPGPTGFIAKKEMKKWPLIGWWMSSVHCLFLDRSDRRQGMATILEGINKLKAGISMWIFPEGTRSKVDGELLPFKKGSFKLATKAGVPIIPVAFNGSSRIFEDHVPLLKPERMTVEFMPPIATAGLSVAERDELPEKVRGIIEERVRANIIE